MNELVELFQTPQVTVRRWIASDLSTILEIYGDKESVRWVGDGTPLTPEQGAKWLEVTNLNYQKRGYGMFTLLERTTGKIIGFGGLVHPDNSVLPEVKYAFLKDYWGKGLASEFVIHLLEFANKTLNLKTIVATVHPDNLASKKVLIKCGFTQEKDILDQDGITTSYFKWTRP